MQRRRAAAALGARPAACGLPIALLVSALALTACGGATSSAHRSATAYADRACAAVRTWLAEVSADSAASAAQIKHDSGAAQVRGALAALLARSSAATGAVVQALRRAGTPDLSGGRAIASALLRSFQAADSRLRELAAQAAALPGSPSAFRAAARALAAAIGGSLNAAGAGLAGLHSGAMAAAAAGSADCRQVASLAG